MVEYLCLFALIVSVGSLALGAFEEYPFRLPTISIKKFLPSTRLRGDISSLDPERIVIGVLLSRAMADIGRIETHHTRGAEWRYSCLAQDGKTTAVLSFLSYCHRRINSNSIKSDTKADFRISATVGNHTISVTSNKKEREAITTLVSLVENRECEIQREKRNQKALDALSLLTVPKEEATLYELNAGWR